MNDFLKADPYNEVWLNFFKNQPNSTQNWPVAEKSVEWLIPLMLNPIMKFG